MPDLRRLFRRLRPAGTPGAAAGAGVPVDRRAELEAELAPVFRALAPSEAEHAAMLDDAARAASHARQRADAHAQRLLADAAAQAPRVQAEAAAAARRPAQTDVRRILGAAQRESERIRHRAESVLPGLVAEAVDLVGRSAGPQDSAPGAS